ncbi:MAG: hypothetical protein ACXV3B_12225 [Ilumatobacteraceae bacterium]
MTVRRERRQHNDSGAALLLAIGAVLMVGAISAGLIGAATSSLQNRSTLEVLRNREWAADSAIEQAITKVRSLDCSTASGSTPDTTNGVGIRVDWTTDCSHGVPTSDGNIYLQRDVAFVACLDSFSACTAANAIIRAQVNFDPQAGPVTKTVVQYWTVNR